MVLIGRPQLNMNKLLIAFLISFITLHTSAQTHIGASLVNASEFEQWGGQVQIGYQFRHLGIRASYGQFFGDQITMKPSTFNFDLNYNLPMSTILRPYLFTGINLTKGESRPAEDLIDYGTYGGLNLGLGGYFAFNTLQPFTEVKFVTGEFKQWYVSTGLRYQITR
jgi:hypothetical protein